MTRVLIGIVLDDTITLPSYEDVLIDPKECIMTNYYLPNFKVLNLDTLMVEDTDVNNCNDIFYKYDTGHKIEYSNFVIVSEVDNSNFIVYAISITFDLHDRLAVFKGNNLVSGVKDIIRIYFYYDKFSLTYDLSDGSFDIQYKGIYLHKGMKKEYSDIELFYQVYLSFCDSTSLIEKIQNGVYKILEDTFLIHDINNDIVVPNGIKKLFIFHYLGVGSYYIIIPQSVDEIHINLYKDDDKFSKDCIFTLYVPYKIKDYVLGILKSEVRKLTDYPLLSDEELLKSFNIDVRYY
jgi:hypothetical protein